MKLNSISGLTCYVKDLDQTAKFYEAIGCRIGNRDETTLTVYVNWFSIKFCAQDKEEKAEFQKEANVTSKGGGIFINIKVDAIDEIYKELLSLGMKPSSEPRDWPWGNREFVLRDPDGYKLVFFEKK
jgi:catechol 2,3-dioxygenase-like lactoylglutathione lyase family enzyme